MKKIIFTALVFFLVFIIYYFNADKKTYYLSLGDQLSYGINNFERKSNGYSENIKDKYKSNLKNYVNYSSIDDYRVMDLINDITYNKEIIYNNKEYKIQNLLIKSNLITISVGINDLLYKKNIDYDYVDQLLKDIENLFVLIRKYNKDQIYFLGFYDIINNPELIFYANERLINVCKRHKIKYVDISNLNIYKYISDRLLNFTK